MNINNIIQVFDKQINQEFKYELKKVISSQGLNDKEIIKWKRDSKLNTLLYNDDYSCFDVHNIENNFVSIYQVGDNLSVVIDVVKKRIINRQDHTLFPYKIRDIV